MLASEEISSDALRTWTPSALTRPAAIAACARARLSNRPRSTRRRSARWRAVIWFHHPPERAGDDGLLPDELYDIAAQVLTERFERFDHDAFGIEACLGVHRIGRVLVEEDVRKHHRPELDPAVENAMLGERLHHVRAEAADRAFLYGEEHLVLAGEAEQQIDIERLGEAGVGDRCRQTVGGEFVGRLETFAEPRAEREQRDLGTFAQDAAFADFERLAFFRHLHAEALAPRIAQRRWPVIDRERSRHHVDQR